MEEKWGPHSLWLHMRDVDIWQVLVTVLDKYERGRRKETIFGVIGASQDMESLNPMAISRG